MRIIFIHCILILFLPKGVKSQSSEQGIKKQLRSYIADTTYRNSAIIKELLKNKERFSQSTKSLLKYTYIVLRSRKSNDNIGIEYSIKDYAPSLIQLLKIIEQWEYDGDKDNLNFAYGNTARSLYRFKVYDYAIIYFKRKLALNIPDKYFAEDIYKLADSYLKLDKEVQNSISIINLYWKRIEEHVNDELKDSVMFEFNLLLIDANYKRNQYVQSLSRLNQNINYANNLSLNKKIEAYTDLAESRFNSNKEYKDQFEILMKNYGKDPDSRLKIFEARTIFEFDHNQFRQTPKSVSDYIDNNTFSNRKQNYLKILKRTGDLHFENGKYKKAYKQYKEIYDTYELNLEGNNRLELYEILGKSAEKIGKNREATKYFKAFIDYKSTMDKIEKIKNQNLKDITYYFRKSKNEVESQSAKLKLQTITAQKDSLHKTESQKLLIEAKARNRRYVNIGLFLMVSISVGFLAFYVRSNRKNNKLLLNILPKKIANELKSKTRFQALKKDKNPTIIDEYTMATVLFTDFKGFTRIAEDLEPEELVEELNQCFAKFDEISKRNNLEKIKTIGDSYMAAGGIPEANTTNPEDAVKAAMEMIDFIEEFNQEKRTENMPEWNVRIGINTGHIVAGIIGKHKYSYDVWGDSVNLASRMESSGEIGKVNISENTYELIKDKYDCSYRGEVEAKNKGKVKMYFVKRRKINSSL